VLLQDAIPGELGYTVASALAELIAQGGVAHQAGDGGAQARHIVWLYQQAGIAHNLRHAGAVIGDDGAAVAEGF